MMSSIILTSSDPFFGILSCNFKSTYLRGKTASNYVLDNLNVGTTSKTVREYMETKKRNMIADAKKGVNIPRDWYKIDGVLHERVIMDKIKTHILKLYIDVYPELYDSFVELNNSESNSIRELLFDHYIQHKFDNTELIDAIDDFVMNTIRRTDGQTIGQYVEQEMNKIKRSVTGTIISNMIKAIRIRLAEPLFIKTLNIIDIGPDNELPFVVPDSNDVDVLEQLNIYLLSKFRVMLRGRDVSALLGGYDTMMNKILVALMRFVAGTRNYLDNDKTQIDDKFVTDVFRLAFPVCDDIIVIEADMPSSVVTTVANTPGFESVDPKIIWNYLQKYVAATGLTTSSSTDNISIVFDKVMEIGDKIMPVNKKISDKERLRQRMQKKASMSNGFSPTVRSSIEDGSKVTVYEMEGCQWCVKAVKLLDDKKKENNKINYTTVTYTEIHRDKLLVISKSKKGSLSFPFIIVDDEYIGGFTELTNILK